MDAMKFDEALIDRSAGDGARDVVLALLAQADRAAQRLGDSSDDEALHDFRVALRRTRSTLRAFRPWLDRSVKRRTEKRLRGMARATNAARDAEVALRWIAEQRPALGSRRGAALDYLARRVEVHRAAWARDQPAVLAEYERCSRKLARRLEGFHGTAGAPARSTSYGGALRETVAEHLAALRAHAASVRGSCDEENVHAARIEAKKVRYLLEPLRGDPRADARHVVKELKALQDVLGDLHDCHALAAEVGAALVDAGAERARALHRAAWRGDGSGAGPALRDDPRAGLLALDRRLAARREALFATLERDWRRGGLDALAAEIEALTAKAAVDERP